MLAAARADEEDLHSSGSYGGLTSAPERGADDISPGDVAAAINGYRAVFGHLVSNRRVVDADIKRSGEVDE